MATLHLKVQDSRFVDHNGVEVEIFTPTYVEANGWKCYIKDNGNIVCIAEQDYDGIRHKCKFELKKGYVKHIVKIGVIMYPNVLKSYKLEAWPVDGVIGLPGGHISSRRPYFRDEEFQKFLQEHGLSAVRHGEASVIYILKEKFRRGEVTYREEIEASDGRTELIFNDIHKRDNDEEGTFTILRKVEVTNATWVIKKVVSGTGINRILYTTENPNKITNLPKR